MSRNKILIIIVFSIIIIIIGLLLNNNHNNSNNNKNNKTKSSANVDNKKETLLRKYCYDEIKSDICNNAEVQYDKENKKYYILFSYNESQYIYISTTNSDDKYEIKYIDKAQQPVAAA